MALRQSILQLRLLSCNLAGALVVSAVMPVLLGGGLDLQNVILAWIVGVVLFLTIATTAGLIWRRSILKRPQLWAIAAPVLLPGAIYLLLRLLTGFEPAEARLALEISLVGGLCALLSSIFFQLWTSLGNGAAPPS